MDVKKIEDGDITIIEITHKGQLLAKITTDFETREQTIESKESTTKSDMDLIAQMSAHHIVKS